MHSVWEIIAIEAPVEVSVPYAAGNTTVLSPRGVPKAKRVRTSVLKSAPRRYKIPMNNEGRTISLRKVAI